MKKNTTQCIYSNTSRENLFEEFYNQNISFTDECETFSDFENLNSKYDAFVCGSDQIWSPLCFDSKYFLDFVNNPDKMIAYAPSLGVFSIDNDDICSEITKLTNRFKWISTREKSGSLLLENLLNRNVATVVDPTLLISKDMWSNYICEEKVNNEEQYLLSYFLTHNEEYCNKVNEIANELNLKVKVIPVFENDFNKEGCITVPVGPQEFLQLIKNATFICTDSFHGTAFSINFQKQFLTFERFKKGDKRNQNSRIYNILELTNLQNRLYNNRLKISEITNGIKYSDFNNNLKSAVEDSLNFLKSALTSVENSNCQPTINNSTIDFGLCCGCNACKKICPVKAISIIDKNGFKTAVVNPDICVLCGKCVQVCPLKGKSNAKSVKDCNLYSYKDYDKSVLKVSSSGGFAYRLSKEYLKKGYTIIGCTLDIKDQVAKHIVIHPHEEEKLHLLQGSKYIQSDFSDAMNEIKNGNDPLVIFGTPCQIAGAKKIAPKSKNIIYVDLICHGVPSQLAYEKYLSFLRKKYNINTSNSTVSFRFKERGWRNRHLYVSDSKNKYCKHQDSDIYYSIFESTFAYSPACYECRWRSASEADIRIGDYWGNRFENDTTGVSMVITLSDKGATLIEELNKSGKTEQHDINDYFKCQQYKNSPKPVFYNSLIESLKTNSIELTYKKYIHPFKKRKEINNIFFRLRKIYKKIK